MLLGGHDRSSVVLIRELDYIYEFPALHFDVRVSAMFVQSYPRRWAVRFEFMVVFKHLRQKVL